MRRTFRVGLILMVLLAGLAVGPPLRAQEPEGDDDFFDSHSVEVVLPAVVSFYLKMNVPRQGLASVALEFTQGSRVLFRGEVNLAETVLVETPFTILRYDHAINPADPPTLFEPAAYRWVAIDSGRESHEAEAEFVFEEMPHTWTHAGEPPLRFSLADSGLNAGVARRAVLPAYDLLRQHTGLEPDFNWAVFPSGHTFCTALVDEQGNTQIVVRAISSSALYPCREADGRRIYAENGYRVLVRGGTAGLIPFENELIADMTAVFYDEYWQGRTVPAWFRSGLAQLYGLTSNPLALRQTQSAARADQLFSAARLDAIPEQPDRRTAWEQQAYTMALYLADAYGADAPFALARAVPADGFQAAFASLTGGNLEDFLMAWERWLFTAEAERAVSWTVYTPTTPTPSPTATATPLPPTPTPTPTVTDTPSPTSTPTATGLIMQFPSPLPTYTATRAITAAPTNTPRPPGSLDQPQGGGGSGGCFAVPGALLLPVAALTVAQYRKQRR